MAKRRRNSLIANIAAARDLISQITEPIKQRAAAEEYAAYQKRVAEGHAAYLRSKYPEQVAQRMLNERLWQGQTAVELADSLGGPQVIDRKMLATRRREIWKYYPQGANRYRLRVTLDDGIVTGWESKG